VYYSSLATEIFAGSWKASFMRTSHPFFFLSKLSEADSVQYDMYVHFLISFLKCMLGLKRWNSETAASFFRYCQYSIQKDPFGEFSNH